MVKTVVAVIVGLVLLNTAWFVLKIVILDSGREKRIRKIQIQKPLSVSTQRGFYHGVLRPK